MRAFNKKQLPLVAVAICGGVICSKRLLGRFFSRKRKQPSADPTSNIVEENACLNTNRHTATRDDRSVYERMRQRTCFRTKTATNNELNGMPCHHEQLVYTHVPNTRVKSRFYREHVRNMVKDGQQVAVPGSHNVPWSAEDDWSIPCTTACQLHEGSSSSHDTDHDHDNNNDDDDASSVESLGCLIDMSEQGVARRRADVPRLDLTKALEIQRMDLMQTEDCE